YIVCNARGCDAARVVVLIDCPDEETIEEEDDDLFIVYSGFSPNGDGINDFFTIKGLSLFESHQLLIFNRLGLKVFESEDYQNDWYGDFGANMLPDGEYFYFLKLADNDPLSGTISIRR
ncbi:MAG: gliding motility-associated C-terminal domain-containing protein, partial [Saprospiraceae bacterium]